MENALDALKIAFAVFVFAMAVALSFRIVGQVRQTSDVIMSINDETTTYDYVDEKDNNSVDKERIVSFETILPTIYRYSEEQYAVSIYDTNEKIIARFDLWTEGFMGNWDQVLKNSKSINNETREEAKKTIANVQNRLNIMQNIVNKQSYDINTLDNLYKVSSKYNSNIKHGAPWVGNSVEIIKRINCDIEGTDYTRNGITYKGKGLNQYKDKKFKEKFIEIQTSGETIIETDDENNVEYSLETIKGNKKLEIVYIMQ